MKEKYWKCFSMSGKTAGFIVLRKQENKIKYSWMLHNINWILEAVHSSETSVSIHKSVQDNIAEDFIFFNTSVKTSDLARKRIL
jgi:hypothetical protein